mgnify:CR=1 FL=1|jgi:uncharacterized membrane protein
MITVEEFDYQPGEHEEEKASNAYVMSLIAVMAGMPLPIINLIATLIFYLGNRRSTYFVRWHCTQALLSQSSLLIINSIGFWWAVQLIVRSEPVSNNFIAYLICVLAYNLGEFIFTIYSAVQTRKGKHVHWWFYGDLTDFLVKE